MDREERLEAMSAADAGALVALADEVLGTLEVEVTRGPSVGLLMMRIEEPADGLTFNFTELTVSEAEVLAGSHRGYAMVLGREPEKVLGAAVLDVALESGHAATEQIERFLEEARRVDAERWQEQWAAIEPTRVRFEDVT